MIMIIILKHFINLFDLCSLNIYDWIYIWYLCYGMLFVLFCLHYIVWRNEFVSWRTTYMHGWYELTNIIIKKACWCFSVQWISIQSAVWMVNSCDKCLNLLGLSICSDRWFLFPHECEASFSFELFWTG